MKRTVNFLDSDAELVQAITEYQKAHGISSFIGAIRKLCKDALKIEEIRH